uniref:Putative secreted protein n=1 Tax=Anopheles marajoara TaxID=58244 RepID=A0A2M4C8J9_9DIPT
MEFNLWNDLVVAPCRTLLSITFASLFRHSLAQIRYCWAWENCTENNNHQKHVRLILVLLGGATSEFELATVHDHAAVAPPISGVGVTREDPGTLPRRRTIV